MPAESSGSTGPTARPPLTEEQRRRLAEVFGDVLPATTADERDDRDPIAERRADEDLLADRPPHHDRER
ncbi:hypothetical protein [Pseudonocardia humida]|uniref:Uncharacterized protein n=1 Tax=Pseudonocardia humida TaxID=2800819 RepID=A0ABT1A7I8_9PSEU|nr:hypothetical protein [Pseudonocardia humida]MCO1658925.1 hypothetical protein [Pseudonocardia humida]